MIGSVYIELTDRQVNLLNYLPILKQNNYSCEMNLKIRIGSDCSTFYKEMKNIENLLKEQNKDFAFGNLDIKIVDSD